VADIDVVPKQRSNMWLWIVLAIVVIAVLIWAFSGRTHAAARFPPAASTPTAATLPSAAGSLSAV